MKNINENGSLETLLGRVLLLGIFIMSLMGKIFDFAGQAAWCEQYFSLLPGELMIAGAIIIEIIGIVTILLGWNMRIGAYLLAFFTFLTAIIFHTDFSQIMEVGLFAKNLAITGGLIILARVHPGKYSLTK